MAPEIKKKITNFLVGEEGQISKKSLVGLGAILAAVGLQAAKTSAGHTSSTQVSYTKPNLKGTHSSSYHTNHWNGPIHTDDGDGGY